MKLFTVILSLILTVHAEKARYDFYRVYKVSIDHKIHLNLLREIENFPDGYKFLTNLPGKIGTKTSIIVPPHKFGEWSELIEKYSMKVHLTTNNLQEEYDRNERNQMRRKSSLDWNRFWTLDEIYGWFQSHIDARPNDLSWFKIGDSYEGREIKGLKVNVGNVAGKSSIFYEATIHGGEWTGATSVTYIVNQLLSDPSMASLLARFEWYFLPVLNVDGFSYAWNVDRNWRKNRKPSSRSMLCTGTDPNRNSNINWNISAVSSNPCSDRYPGDYAFSEPEIFQFTEFMKTIPNLDIFISFHQYGQYTMMPSGYTDAPIDSYQLHYEIGEIATEAIYNKTGIEYQLGTTAHFIGLVSGTTLDWVFDNLHPKIAFCWEVRPTWDDGNEVAFSPAMIEPTGQDMYAATITAINEAIKRGVV